MFITLDKLINLGDIRSAIELGRAYLKKERFVESTEIFSYLRDNVDKNNVTYYKVLANLGNSLIGEGNYDEAIEYLRKVEKIRFGADFRAWHSLAIAYAYNKLGELDLYEEWLDKSKGMAEYKRNVNFFKALYPDISADL